MDRLLEKVTDHAIALLGAEHGFVVLSNEDGELEARAARSRKGDDTHAQFSHSVAETVVRTGEPVIAERAKDDERLAKAVSVHALSIQSIACVPIRGAPPAGRTIGALYIETRLRPGARFEAELPTLAAFADQAAIAIENARLLEENRDRTDELARANVELEAARDKLASLLDRKTEQLATVKRDLKQVRAELRSHFGYGGLVGTSAPMRRLYALLDRLKDTDVPVLITGESGTGKEVVAKAIHAQSQRARKPFLGVNCGAIPANLLESELFGHVRGAFTGAERDKKGLFREAEGGTILLDEIGEMPLKMQTSLLRTLQEGTVRPLGGAKEEPVDVRVVAATNRDLEAMVREQTFREDLYYRLHVIELKVPALRDRSDDIPALIDHFLTLFAARYRRDRKTIGRDALRRLVAYEWPGNVRQLENVLLNAWLMGEGSEIGETISASSPTRARRAISETVARARAARTRGRRLRPSSRRPSGTGSSGALTRVQLEPRAGGEDDRAAAADVLSAAEGVRDPRVRPRRTASRRRSRAWHRACSPSRVHSARRSPRDVADLRASGGVTFTRHAPASRRSRSDASRATRPPAPPVRPTPAAATPRRHTATPGHAGARGAAPAPRATDVTVGQPPPDFTSTDQDGKPVHLADLKGHPVVVYFYPKDETPGCTKEACSFRDAWTDLQKKGVIIIGVSTDTADSHKAFAKNHQLPFVLVSDSSGEIAKKYGVPVDEGYTKRQSFVVAPDGTLKKIYRKVDVTKHAQEIAQDTAS